MTSTLSKRRTSRWLKPISCWQRRAKIRRAGNADERSRAKPAFPIYEQRDCAGRGDDKCPGKKRDLLAAIDKSQRHHLTQQGINLKSLGNERKNLRDGRINAGAAIVTLKNNGN
ncbi:hypothetical protein M5585_27440 [Serratia ureilytica]